MERILFVIFLSEEDRMGKEGIGGERGANGKRSYHEIMSSSRQFLCNPSKSCYQGSSITSELIGQEVHPWNQVLHLATFPNVIERIISVCSRVGKGGPKEGLE